MDALRPREHAPELLADEGVAEGVGNGGEFGPQQPHQRHEVASTAPGHRGAEEAETLHPLGTPQSDLDRHPPTERVADQMGPADPQGVHEAADRTCEPGGVVGGAERLGGGSEPRKVDGVDGVLGGESRDRLVEARLVATQPVDQDHRLDPVAGRQRRYPGLSRTHLVDAKQWRAPLRALEEPLEGDRQVEVPPRPEAPRAEGVEAGELALAQLEPGGRVGSDHRVGIALG